MGEPVYLPASRTGFMLTYPQLIENSLFSFAPASQENSSSLTLPYVDFLQLITKFDTKASLTKQNTRIVRYIENNMTKGKIAVKKDMLPVIKYMPDGTILGPDEISMYQFASCEGGKNQLQELQCTQYGFIVPTFNDALDNIMNEVYAFQED